MAKTDQSTRGAAAAPATLDANAQALVAALTAAIVSARRDVTAPNQRASEAAFEYEVIKSALRTHAEGLHGFPAALTRRRVSKG